MTRTLRFAPGTSLAPSARSTHSAPDPLVALRNPYVRWAVSSHGVPPWPIDYAEWTAGHKALTVRVKDALKRFDEPSPAWPDFERLALEMARWEALRGWGRFAAQAASGSDQALARRTMAASDRLFHEVCDKLRETTAHKVLSQWVLPGHRGLSALEKTLLKAELNTWSGGQGPKDRQALRLNQEIIALTKRRTSAKERTKAIAQGVLVTDSKVLKGMPTMQLDIAATHAAERGQEGWLFLPGTWESYHAQGRVHDREVREALWRQENDLGFTADSGYGDILHRLCEARQEYALTQGCRSYAAYEMWGRAEESVRRMETFLSQGLKKIGPEARRAYRALGTYMKQNHGIAHQEPWDRRYAETCWREAYRSTLMDRSAFPWLPTLHQAVPELLRVGGWTVIERNDHGGAQTAVIHWVVRHDDGRKAHLWMDVFAHTSEDGGQSYAVRSTRLNTVTVVHLAFDPQFEGMDHENMVILAHELGHALHELAMSSSAGQHDEAFPWDAVEVPSHLLQQYVFDQRVLRRWASPLAQDKVRRSAYWNRFFSADPIALLDLQLQWYNAWFDLKIHSLTQSVDLEAFDRKHRLLFGLPPVHADDRKVYNNGPVWDTYSAGFYAYPWADCLVHHLVGTHPDGQAQAGEIATAFVALQEQVLRRVGPLPFNSVWKQSQGATAWQCALTGRDSYLTLMIQRSREARTAH